MSSELDQNCGCNNVKVYDVAIVGGGMVGMALTCSLATMPLTKHLNVAIIDNNLALMKKLCTKVEDPPDPRVVAVTPATISFFKDAGAWKYVQQNRHAYFDRMQVWDYTGLGYTKYKATDIDEEILGCVVENKVLHNSLWMRIEEMDFQKTIYSSRLTSISLHPGFSRTGIVRNSSLPEDSYLNGRLVKLDLMGGNSLYAKLVVGADGAKSHVREIAGFKRMGWNYPQDALICTVEQQPMENQCAWQRFLPAGPIAMLPMGGRFCNIIWTASPEEALAHKSMKEAEFVNAINHALTHGCGLHPKLRMLYGGDLEFDLPPKVIKLASARMTFPLSLMHSKNYVSSRIALVGDAAHTVHPLAGQGANLGFGDVSALSSVIARSIALGLDIGEERMLKRYEAERKPANIAMMAILDGFQKAFSVDFGPLNTLRAAAFHVANHVLPLKRSIISYASGHRKLPFFLPH